MGFAASHVEDHTRLAVIVAKLHATATCPVLLAYNPAKSAATIRNAVSFVMSHAPHVPRTALGLARIVDDANCHVRCHVTCYHAQSAAQRCWHVDINARLSVERSVLLLHTVNPVRYQN